MNSLFLQCILACSRSMHVSEFSKIFRYVATNGCFYAQTLKHALWARRRGSYSPRERTGHGQVYDSIILKSIIASRVMYLLWRWTIKVSFKVLKGCVALTFSLYTIMENIQSTFRFSRLNRANVQVEFWRLGKKWHQDFIRYCFLIWGILTSARGRSLHSARVSQTT